MIGELVSAGVGLLGSLFGKKKKQEPQVVKNEVDYAKMSADAAAAGFNPLTAIRNGGSAGFTTTTSSPTISQSPSVLENLGGILGNALGDMLDPISAKRREVDTLLVDRQLRQLKEGPQIPASFKPARLFSGTKVSQQLVPRLGAVSSNRTASVPAASKAFIGPPSPQQWAKDNGGMDMYVPYFNRFTNSIEYGPNPDIADAEQFPMPSMITGANAIGPITPLIKGTSDRYKNGFRRINKRPLVTVRPATPSESKANRDSWHGGWLPSFSYK